ncbi:HAD hydrolase-like protein [Eisenbergiella sp.]
MNGEKRRYTHILFDLDGTLSDPKAGITGSVQYALKALGIEEPDADKLEPFIGPPLKDSFREFYGLDEEQADFAVQKYRERFKDQGIFENTLYPGMKELLKRLKEAGCVLAVASSKPEVFVNRILHYFDICDCFKVVVGSELDGTRSQKEEVVAEALKRLFADENIPYESIPYENIPYESIAMVGDRKFDISGALEFGLHPIGVAYGYAGEGELEAAGAEYIAQSVEDLDLFLLQGKM